MIFNYFSDKCLQFITGKIKRIDGTGTCYLGFSTTVPKADGTNITEPNPNSFPSYERIQLNIYEAMTYTDKWDAVSSGKVTNKYEFTSREALEDDDGNGGTGWPEFVWFVIFDAKTEGNALVGDVLRDPDGTPDATTGLLPEKTLKVDQNKVAVFRADMLQLTLE